MGDFYYLKHFTKEGNSLSSTDLKKYIIKSVLDKGRKFWKVCKLFPNQDFIHQIKRKNYQENGYIRKVIYINFP